MDIITQFLTAITEEQYSWASYCSKSTKSQTSRIELYNKDLAYTSGTVD